MNEIELEIEQLADQMELTDTEEEREAIHQRIEELALQLG